MNDDLILILDSQEDITLTDDGNDDLLLVDDVPHVPHVPVFPEYTGECVFTPSLQTQIAPTIQKVLLRNITINPIPNNYGLITYNGNTITVS